MNEPDNNTDVEHQPNLLDVPAVFQARLEADGIHTAERLKAQRPDHYQIVIDLLSRGHGAQFIEDYFHGQGLKMSKNTVKGVRRAEGETIDLLKTRLADAAFDIADQAQEAVGIIIAETMSNKLRREKLTIKDAQALQFIASTATTNGQLLTGKPTANVNVEVWAKPPHNFNAEIAEAFRTHLVAEKNAGLICEQAEKTVGEPGRAAAAGENVMDAEIVTPEPTTNPLITQQNAQ